jgi:hypothetical protein
MICMLRGLGFAPVGPDRAIADLAHDLAVFDDPLVDARIVALDAERAVAEAFGCA